MHTLSRWVLLASAGTLLLLLGGRLTAYITPGEFLGSDPTPITSASSAASSVLIPILPLPTTSSPSSSILIPTLPRPPSSASTSSTYLLPTLFGPAAASSSSTYLLPTLFGPAVSSSSFLLPTLAGVSSQAVSTGAGNSGGYNGGNGNDGGNIGSGNGNGGGNNGKSGMSGGNPGNGGTWSTYSPNGGRTTYTAGIAVAPAYDTYYQRLAGSALQPAAPLVAMAESMSSAKQSSLSNVFPAQPSAALPITVAGVSEEVLVTTPLHAGTEALPASGFPYALACLLAVIAGFFVLRSVRRMELLSSID